MGEHLVSLRRSADARELSQAVKLSKVGPYVEGRAAGGDIENLKSRKRPCVDHCSWVKCDGRGMI